MRLEFERPLVELQQQIEEVKRQAVEEETDRSVEIRHLEAEVAEMQERIYTNLTPWQKRKLTSQSSRPTTLDYVKLLFTDFLELHGDRLYGDDPAIVGGIARFEGRPVTVIGHQKGHDTKENLFRNFGMPHPEGYRKALRLMQQAAKFRRPIVCFVDTPGAYPGMAAEERGQSEAIARNLREMALLEVPIITVVTGEGGSGGALALGVGDRLYMLEHAIYSVISPEGAAALLWKDASQAQRAAETMRITAQDLHQFGIADEIIPEPLGGAQKDYPAQAGAIRKTLAQGLQELAAIPKEQLLQQRYEKYKAIGPFQV